MTGAESSARTNPPGDAPSAGAQGAGAAHSDQPRPEAPPAGGGASAPGASASAPDSEVEYMSEPEQGTQIQLEEQAPAEEQDADAGIGRGDWQGSRVTQFEIDWLVKSRRIPEGVVCRLPGNEISPDPMEGERVVFTAHFERGFGLPVSHFFRAFIDKFHLQPHHLPPNSILFLSALATFEEGYLGVWPSSDLAARVYIVSPQTKHNQEGPGPKEMVECGAAVMKPRRYSEYFKVQGLGSAKKWLTTWFYVKNKDPKQANQLNLPTYVPGPPAHRDSWEYYPNDEGGEVQDAYTQIQKLAKEGQLRPEDLILTFLKRRVSPLQLRPHKICHMSGLLDPTRHSTFELADNFVWERLKAISRTALDANWKWGKVAYSQNNMPPVRFLYRPFNLTACIGFIIVEFLLRFHF